MTAVHTYEKKNERAFAIFSVLQRRVKPVARAYRNFVVRCVLNSIIFFFGSLVSFSFLLGTISY